MHTMSQDPVPLLGILQYVKVVDISVITIYVVPDPPVRNGDIIPQNTL